MNTKHANHRARANAGFTVLELLVVMSVMVLLLGALVPAIWNVENEGRLSAGVNTVTAAVQAARAYAIERKADLISIPGAAHSGSGIIFAPGGEMRHVINFQSARADNSNQDELETVGYNGYRDIPAREYGLLPAGVDLVGIVGEGQLVFPPFGIRFDRQSRLVPGIDPRTDSGHADHASADFSTFIIYDSNSNGLYGIDAARPGTFGYAQYKTWDHSRDDFEDIKASGAGFNETVSGGRYNLPFERLEPVIGVIVYSKFDFEDSGASDLLAWVKAVDSDTGKLANGTLVYFGRYSGTAVKQ